MAETIISSNLFIYGKDIFFQGVQLPMILKKMCRANLYSENSRPSLYQAMASAGPPFSAAASFDISPSLYYQLYLYHLSEVMNFFFYTMSIAGRGALHTSVSTEPMMVQNQELR